MRMHGGIFTEEGSPPRGRGRQGAPDLRVPVVGITPAWAGKALIAALRALVLWDHPRVGGEGLLSTHNDGDAVGSPPRGRGRLPGKCLLEVADGITPAWAGKASPIFTVTNTAWDHPRVGGEG